MKITESVCTSFSGNTGAAVGGSWIQKGEY